LVVSRLTCTHTHTGEMADVFPDPVLMLGGDEVGLSCHDPDTGKPMLSSAFDRDPAAAARMETLGINSSQVTDYFWEQITTQVMQSKKLKDKTLQIWYCPDCHTGDPPLLKMPKGTVADVWGALDFAATACRAGYESVMSMSRGPNATAGESGAGWYLPPYGGADGGGLWPGTWQRDLDAELEARGCDKKGRDSLVLGGSAAAWSSDTSTFDFYTWQGTVGVAERLWVGSGADGQGDVFNLTAALPRLAVHACRMKSRGFVVAQYTPSTFALSGMTHWCTGGAGGAATNGNLCAPCPAEWSWPVEANGLRSDAGPGYDPVQPMARGMKLDDGQAPSVEFLPRLKTDDTIAATDVLYAPPSSCAVVPSKCLPGQCKPQRKARAACLAEEAGLLHNRTLSAVLGGLPTVLDFGAQANSSVDDTPSFSFALAHHPTLRVPPGSYRIDGTITLGSAHQLILDAGATLVRYNVTVGGTVNTDPIIRFLGHSSAVSGSGVLEMQVASPRGAENALF
jgi:hypothetical protein